MSAHHAQPLEERQIFESINNILGSILGDTSSAQTPASTAAPPTTSRPPATTSRQSASTPPSTSASTPATTTAPTTTQQRTTPSTTQEPTRTNPTTTSTPTRAPSTSSRETSTSTVITTPSTSRQTITEMSTSGTEVVPVTRVITMTQPVVVVTSTPSDQNQSSTKSSSEGGKIGGIVGGVVGGLALLTLLGLIALLWRRRKARTGHGWFLCFGTRPGHGRGDPNDWPTFDPVQDGASGGGGSRFGRKRKNVAQATLPEGFEGADPESLGGDGSSGEHMRENAAGVGFASLAGGGSYAAYSHASNGNSGYHAASQDALSGGHMSTAPPGSYGGPSDEGHFSLGQAGNGWGVTPPAGAALGAYRGAGSPPPVVDAPGPDYGHLDPPEVREQRAREQQAAWAAASVAQARSTSPALSGGHGSVGAPQLPDVGRQASLGSIGAVTARAASPPPPGYSAAGPSTADAYAGMTGQDAYNLHESDKRGRLHLSNPDE